MNKEKLYELLEIEDPSDFEYFENFASYIECPDEIDEKDLLNIFSQVDSENLSFVIQNYFDEIIDNISGESSELILIFENEKRVLRGLLKDFNPDNVSTFVDEIERFREYYSINCEVEVINMDSGEEELSSICDSLFTTRQEKFDNSRHRINYSNVLNYEMNEYIMSFSDIINEEDFGDED